MKYTALRAHQGDKWYAEGDEREASPSDVAHLVASGTLVEKKAAPVNNKAEPPVKNKSA